MQHKLKKPIHTSEAITEVHVHGGMFQFGQTQTVPDPTEEKPNQVKEVKGQGHVSINIGPPPGKMVTVKLSPKEEEMLEDIVRRGLEALG